MRLINTNSLLLEEFPGDFTGRYAILSHTWEDDEMPYQDMLIATRNDPQGYAARKKAGYRKIRKFAKVALADNFQYVWVDTCCIDKTSSAELSESINCMFRWYGQASRCYVYLTDVPSGNMVELNAALKTRVIYDSDNVRSWTSENGKPWKIRNYCKLAWPSRGAIDHPFYQSRWFTRGWTLQELIAPSDLVFYYSDWTPGPRKSDHSYILYRITGIPENVLESGDCSCISVADRMRWASTRTTTRIEDMAYCLLGIFDVNMPMLYGEREKSFLRLQEEICKISDDQSIFAWRHRPASETHSPEAGSKTYRGLFARSPEEFAINSVVLAPIEPDTFIPPFSNTSIGFNAQFPLIPLTDASKLKGIVPVIETSTHDAKNEYLAILNAKALQSWHIPGKRAQPGHRVAILLKALTPGASTRQYARVKPSTVYTLTREDSIPAPTCVYIRNNVRIPGNHGSQRWAGFMTDLCDTRFPETSPSVWALEGRSTNYSWTALGDGVTHLISNPNEDTLKQTNGVAAMITSSHKELPFVVLLGRTHTGKEDGPGIPTFWIRKKSINGPPEDYDFSRTSLRESIKADTGPPHFHQLKFERYTMWFTLSWLPKLVDDMLFCSFSIKCLSTPPDATLLSLTA